MSRTPVEGRPGVFLDRDGTIIEDRHYLGDPREVRLLEGAAEAITRLNEADLPVVVVTNQSGIGRGLISEAQYFAVRARMEELLAAAGARLTATYHCPHDPRQLPPCECRKPLSGLFERAAREHLLDLRRSHFIGDRWRDVAAGVRIGGAGYLVQPDAEPEDLDLPAGVTRVRSLSEAVALLIAAGAGPD